MSLNKYEKNGERFFQLMISCPVCQEEGRNTRASFWVHDTDGGELYVSDRANYQCKKCNHTQHVCKWTYACPDHADENGEFVYKGVGKETLASVMSCAGQLVTETGLPWLQAYMENLETGWS